MNSNKSVKIIIYNFNIYIHSQFCTIRIKVLSVNIWEVSGTGRCKSICRITSLHIATTMTGILSLLIYDYIRFNDNQELLTSNTNLRGFMSQSPDEEVA